MNSENPLKKLIDRHLPSPSYMEVRASHDRLLRELRSTLPHLQRPRIADPAPPAASWRQAWRPAVSLAAAAAIIAIVVTVLFQRGSWIATVEAADGSRYTLELNEALRLTDGDAMLTLTDGSRVEMRSQAELSLERETDGLGIRLQAGDIIVDAAAQRDGRLYVHTKDMTVAVAGTVFLVNAGADGSRVAVIEGEVRVQEGAVEKRLRPGEQAATSPTIARWPVKEAISWSRNADVHIAQLETFMKGMAQSAGPLARVASLADRPAATAAQAAPEFEEASIRECDPDEIPAAPPGARGGGANSFYMTPGRTYMLCMTLATIIRTAYGYSPADLDILTGGRRGRGPTTLDVVYGLGVEDGLRVRGGPDWVRSQRYTIEAVADGAVTGDTMRGPMLRALLERRFKLKAHVETEQVPAFALLVAPGGLKITPAEPDSCFSFPPDPTVPTLNGVPVGARRPMLADVRRGEKRVCGQLPERNGPNQVFVVGGATFSELAQVLAIRLGRVRVEDKTGITDRFDWVLEFAADENPPGSATLNPQTAAEPSSVPRGPTIFVALEQQLGLRLEPTQTPREFLVIDAIERPEPN